MPYYITDKSPDCSGWAAVTAEGRVIGCHKTKQGAIDQMVAVSLAEGLKPGGTYEPRAVSSGSYNPPAGVQSAAKRALKWISEGKAGGGFTSVGHNRASQLASGVAISAATVNKMISYFARHEVDKQAEGFSYGEKNFPSPGRVAWDAWGGDAGKSWVNGLSSRSLGKTELSETRIDSGNSNSEAVLKTNTAKTENRWLAVANTLVSRLSPIHEAPVSEERGKKMETRINHVDMELRAVDATGMTFEGYAAVFNSPSDPIGGQFTEYVMPGAFKRSLDARNDVKLLWNHDTGEVLGSTRSGTLRLIEDSHGLKAIADLPNTQRGRDTAELIKRGDVVNMSFGFSVPKGGDSWTDGGATRHLNSVRLYEVSVVSYPAYPSSSASVRAAQFSADALAEALSLLESGEDLTEEQAQMISDVAAKLVKTDSMDVSTDPVEPMAMIPLSDGMDAPDGMPGADMMCECGCDCGAGCSCNCECDCEDDSESGTKISVEVEVELNSSGLDVKKKNLDLLMKRL